LIISFLVRSFHIQIKVKKNVSLEKMKVNFSLWYSRRYYYSFTSNFEELLNRKYRRVSIRITISSVTLKNISTISKISLYRDFLFSKNSVSLENSILMSRIIVISRIVISKLDCIYPLTSVEKWNDIGWVISVFHDVIQ